MIQRIRQTNPKLALALFVVALAHRPILSSLSLLFRKLKRPILNEGNEYVGIYISPTEYLIGVGVPNLDRNNNIIDFSLTREKRGVTNLDPRQTQKEIVNYLGKGSYYFVGVSCFSVSDGTHTRTKESPESNMWSTYPIFSEIKNEVKAKRYSSDLSINANTLAEFRLGNHGVNESLVYIDISQTINIGIISGSEILHGLNNKYGGHISVERHPSESLSFRGTCSFHPNCLEGFIATKAISCRCGTDILRLHTIRDDNSIWNVIGFYIAQLCLNLTLLLSPQVIVVTGDVMNRKRIFGAIEEEFQKMLNGYLVDRRLERGSIGTYITRPKVASSGIKGSMLLDRGMHLTKSEKY